MSYASVIVNISHENLDKVYEYEIPKEWEASAKIGAQVLIPFGAGNRERKGFILDIAETSEYDPAKIKPLKSILTDGMVLESHFIQLAVWMRQQYGATMNDALRAVLPVKKNMKEREKKFLHLTVSREQLSCYMEECERKHYKARLRLAQVLEECDSIEMGVAIKEYKVSRDAIKVLEELGILRISREKTYRNPVESHITEKYAITLTKKQQHIVDSIWNEYALGIRDVYLLHGVTGSGKTEVYMEIMDRVIASGQQVIFLIPEIALTVPMVERFYQRFGDRISVLHSKLSEGERSDQYNRARNGEIDIMIGPRSALFTPFERLGLIVMDEEHEPSFQSENLPKYHAREVAIKRAQMCHASVILGSATPSVESYYRAKQGAYKLFSLSERIGNSKLPKVTVVDLREELKVRNRSIFSGYLAERIKECLEQKKQVLLFVNRRGYAGFVSCRACGYVMKCTHCDVSLTEHNNGKLMCHYCGFEQIKPTVCPNCGSKYMAAFGIGTQKVEKYARKEFPEAKILRMDSDTTGRKGEYETILNTFVSGNADIMIGTQMIAKGHDFSNVALVGAVAADMSLYFNDFRSSERTFQLLSQAGGRAGRRKDAGELVIQTYDPTHYSIEMTRQHNYEGFYENELAYRSLLGYPPMGHIMAILIISKNLEKVDMAAKLCCGAAKERPEHITIIGPANATIFRVNDYFRKVIYIKAKEKEKLVVMKEFLEGYTRYSQYFQQVNIHYDIDPMNGY